MREVKRWMIPAILLVIIGGFMMAQSLPQLLQQGSTITGTEELIPSEHDLRDLGLVWGDGCETETYEKGEHSSLAQHSICFYNSTSNDTEVIIQMSRFTNNEDLNGAYQYDSSHLFGSEGLISEDTFGDQSTFRVSSEDDYMGHLNDPDVYVYHLWITKDLYLIHVTSSGTVEAEEQIAAIGELILSGFG